MNESTLVLFTRVTEQCQDGRKEWENIWGFDNANYIVTVDSSISKLEHNNQPTENIITNASLIILKGRANLQYTLYSEIIQKIQKNIIMAIHPGMGGSVEDSKRSLCAEMSAIKDIINNAVGYTLGCDNDTHQVVIFAKKLKSNEVTLEDLNKLKQFFSQKKPNPYLIALSVLCQGYLATHGKLDSLKEKPIENAGDKIKLTESPDWWEIIKTSESVRQEIGSLSNDIKIDGEPAKKEIQTLISYLKDNAILKEGDLTPKVQNTYKALCALEKSGRFP